MMQSKHLNGPIKAAKAGAKEMGRSCYGGVNGYHQIVVDASRLNEACIPQTFDGAENGGGIVGILAGGGGEVGD